MKTTTITKYWAARERFKQRLIASKGEAWMDTLVKILIGIVVGGLVLTLTVTLINTLWPEITAKLLDMFNFGGATGGASGAGGV